MAQVLVRNIDETIVQTLKRKARLHGRSLEQELRVILADAAQPTGRDRADLAALVRAMTPRSPQTDSTELVRHDRDRR